MSYLTASGYLGIGLKLCGKPDIGAKRLPGIKPVQSGTRRTIESSVFGFLYDSFNVSVTQFTILAEK